MQEYLQNQTQSSALELLDTFPVSEVLSVCRTESFGVELFEWVLRYQDCYARVISQIGTPGVVELLNSQKLKVPTLSILKTHQVSGLDRSELISALINLLSSADSTPGNLAKDLLVSSFQEDVSNYSLQLKDLFERSDSIVQLRIVDLVVAMSSNPQHFQAFEQVSLIERAIDLFTSEDILTRLTAIEVVAELGNTPHGASKLTQQRVKQLISSCLDSNIEDVHSKSRLFLLASKIFHFTGNTHFIDEQFWQTLHQFLESQEPSLVNSGVTAVCFIGSQTPGPDLIAEKQGIVKSLAKLQVSANDEYKIGFYKSLEVVCHHASENTVRGLVNSFRWFDPVLKQIKAPFSELMETILRFVLCLMKFEWSAGVMFNEPSFAEFMLKRTKTQTQEISYLKHQINRKALDYNFDQVLLSKLREYVQTGPFAPSEGFVEEAVTQT